MAVVTLGDLLSRAAKFEERLENYYASVRDHSTCNNARFLTYNLARHRHHSQQGFEGMDDSQMERIHAVELEDDGLLAAAPDSWSLDATPDKVTGNTLLENALNYDGRLIEFYKTILQHHLTDEARDVLQTLVRIEERDIVMIKKIRAMHYF